MSINLVSTSDSPANTQHHDSDPTPSILEDVISGLIEPRSDAPGEYKPTLIANRPGGLTMREEIGNSLATSDSFDISVAFVSADYLNEKSFQRSQGILGAAASSEHHWC